MHNNDPTGVPTSISALDTPTYSLGDVVKVTRVPIGTVRMWLERKILELGPHDKDASGKGSTRQFTLRTVYLAATMAEIARLGVSPSIAAKWAELIWRDTLSSTLAPHDDMIFVGNPTNRTAHICRPSDLTPDSLFHKSSWPLEENDLSAVIIDVTGVARKCRSTLGLNKGEDLTEIHL